MAAVLDLLRLLLGATLLSFAAYTDWQWRRAPNLLWIVMAAAGAALLVFELVLDPALARASWPYLAFIPGFAALVWLLWRFGLIAGGADAKALMALGVLVPFPLRLAQDVPPLESPMPGAFAVLSNSLLLFLAIPLAFLLWNLAHGRFRLPHAFLGIQRPARLTRRGHVWPMEVVDEEGNRRSRLFASRMSAGELDEAFERLQALGDARVWVTPKVPFMLPLLGGFVLAFLAGDLLQALLRAALS